MVQIPGVSTSAVTVSNPFANIYRHGDKLVYDQLTISAVIDEDLKTWQETYDWLLALTKPEKFEQYNRFYDSNKKLYHDATLTLNTNANVNNIRVKFFNCHPTSISSVQFNTSDNANTILTADIVFRYDYYELFRFTS
jgi:4-hydroxyphenylpyruvate dioxygenase-like putative hemolysin